jgi:hypothetical protein
MGVGVIAVASARGDSRTSRDIKGSPVSFRLASTTPISGYDKMTMEGGGVVYVSARPIWSGGEVVSAQSRDGAGLELTLTTEAARRVASLASGSGNRVAVFVDGKLASVGALNAGDGRTTITGLNALSAERVLRLLNGVRPAPQPSPTTAILSVVPAGSEGDLYFVDVFVQGVKGLRTYQITLEVEGGATGDLVREEVTVDEARPDFVFTELSYLVPADQVGGRVAGVLVNGPIDRAEPGYMGTYAYRATPDASGTFQVSIAESPRSFLADNDNTKMDFYASAAEITIGEVAPRDITK